MRKEKVPDPGGPKNHADPDPVPNPPTHCLIVTLFGRRQLFPLLAEFLVRVRQGHGGDGFEFLSFEYDIAVGGPFDSAEMGGGGFDSSCDSGEGETAQSVRN
jgi:hypothetical protein